MRCKACDRPIDQVPQYPKYCSKCDELKTELDDGDMKPKEIAPGIILLLDEWLLADSPTFELVIPGEIGPPINPDYPAAYVKYSPDTLGLTIKLRLKEQFSGPVAVKFDNWMGTMRNRQSLIIAGIR